MLIKLFGISLWNLSTSCRKTNYLLKILEKDYNKHFDFIVLVCPMFEWKYIKDNDFIEIQCDTIIKHVTNIYERTNTVSFGQLCSFLRCQKSCFQTD